MSLNIVLIKTVSILSDYIVVSQTKNGYSSLDTKLISTANNNERNRQLFNFLVPCFHIKLFVTIFRFAQNHFTKAINTLNLATDKRLRGNKTQLKHLHGSNGLKWVFESVNLYLYQIFDKANYFDDKKL